MTNVSIEDMAAELESHLLSSQIFRGKYETKHVTLVTLTLPAAAKHWLLTQTEVGWLGTGWKPQLQIHTPSSQSTHLAAVVHEAMVLHN